MDRQIPVESTKEQKNNISPQELRSLIWDIKRRQERDFQEQLKQMTPEERKKAIEFANDLL